MTAILNAIYSLALLLPKRHIFLLSHMRAHTSLFSHIMGSNPAICGYYEMHIGYHSWKSLYRQKLLFARGEDAKPQCTYMFDKILHDDHLMSIDVLDRHNTLPIFSLRNPRATIPSIMTLYNSVDSTHAFNSSSVATDYYIQRLATLENLAESIQRPFFFTSTRKV